MYVGLTECELVCATCLLAYGCAGVGRAKIVDGNREGQARSPCAMVREW